jgi:predicted cation transporter
VLFAGLLFHFGKGPFQAAMHGILKSVPLGALLFAIVVVLGLVSSIITAIISALFLVEIVNLMPLERRDKINLVIIACFSIGLGAVLTPLGEPLSTIAVVKPAGPPYHATFWYLFSQLGVLVILGVVACGLFAVFFIGKRASSVGAKMEAEGDEGGVKEVLVRTVKVYAFVSALFLLGAGMEVIINKYFIQLPATALYWLNMVSAILDNATLTAAEIGPSMSQAQITASLMGLLISGGMLIPGNIPYIISAGKLGITSGEWAKLGVPMGLVLNAVYFVAIFVFGFSPTLGL